MKYSYCSKSELYKRHMTGRPSWTGFSGDCRLDQEEPTWDGQGLTETLGRVRVILETHFPWKEIVNKSLTNNLFSARWINAFIQQIFIEAGMMLGTGCIYIYIDEQKRQKFLLSRGLHSSGEKQTTNKQISKLYRMWSSVLGRWIEQGQGDQEGQGWGRDVLLNGWQSWPQWKGTYEQRIEGGEEGSHGVIWRKSCYARLLLTLR